MSAPSRQPGFYWVRWDLGQGLGVSPWFMFQLVDDGSWKAHGVGRCGNATELRGPSSGEWEIGPRVESPEEMAAGKVTVYVVQDDTGAGGSMTVFGVYGSRAEAESEISNELSPLARSVITSHEITIPDIQRLRVQEP